MFTSDDERQLGRAILDYIRDNIAIEDLEEVYPNFRKELSNTYAPDDIFPPAALAEWADANGFKAM